MTSQRETLLMELLVAVLDSVYESCGGKKANVLPNSDLMREIEGTVSSIEALESYRTNICICNVCVSHRTVA